MSLAQTLHELIYRQPRGETQTALLFSCRPDWAKDGGTSCRRYVAAMSRAALEDAYVQLAGTIAQYGQPVAQRLDGEYPPNGADL